MIQEFIISQFFSIFFQTILAFCTPLALILLYKVVSVMEAKLNLNLTESQKDTIRGAANTAAGLIETAILNGKLTDVSPHNPSVQQIVGTAFQNVTDSMKSLTVTPEVATNMSVAAHAKLMIRNQ